jgi:AmmeMemoRadiSam system protein A
VNERRWPQIDAGQRRVLLGMTRAAVEVAVGAEAAPDPRRQPGSGGVREILSLRCGLFVTLRRKDRGGELRGCIGRMMSERPLRETLPEVAADAALKDRRFPPVDTTELPSLSVELSLLSPMEPADSWRDIIIGTHGIYLRRGFRSAVFLPEVAVEQGWDLETTLTRLALKGGMDADAWRQADAEFSLFTSIHFAEGTR